jgi:hypothetical protein
MDKLGIAYNLWIEENGRVKPEKWWDRFGDEPDHYNQTFRLIHRLAKLRKLVRERTRDNQNLVNIYQQILQQAENTWCVDRAEQGTIPKSEGWTRTGIVKQTIQEREGRYEKIGPETFVIKVQEEALEWAEGEWVKIEEHKGPGDIKIGRRGCPNPMRGENEVTYVKKIRLTKLVKDETHEWTMIELRKKGKSREQNVYKTKGPDITTENIQFLILRAMGEEKLEEMG